MFNSRMVFCCMLSDSMSSSEKKTILKSEDVPSYNLPNDLFKIVGRLLFMLPVVQLKTISGPECFFAVVAGYGDSFQMVCFNVIFYVSAMAFLSTHFAPIS